MLGWGPTTVLAVETIGVRNIPDLYRLKNDSALSSLVGEKTAATLIAEVDKTRRLNPEVFLGALGIEGLGVETAKKILSVYLWNDPENHKLLPARLATIPGIGETTARTITGGLRNYEHLIDELLAHIDLTPSSTTPQGSSSGPFVGKKVVFTGALTAMERSTAQELVRQAGGETPTSLTKQTDVLVVGDESRDRNTTKLDKARKYGTEIIDETEFARRLAEC
jgi:DNA ligase (NAD+)